MRSGKCQTNPLGEKKKKWISWSIMKAAMCDYVRQQIPEDRKTKVGEEKKKNFRRG